MTSLSVVEPVLPDADLQGDALAGFRKNHAAYLFLAIEDVRKAKASLAALVPRISPLAEVAAFNEAFRRARARQGEPFAAMTAVWLNVAFSASGLTALTSAADVAEFTDGPFKLGMRAQSSALGDPSDSNAPGHVSRWLFGGDRVVHAVVFLAADDSIALDGARDETSALLAGPQGGWLLVHDQECAVRNDRPGHEHFGFRDGISQPSPRGKLSSGAVLAPRYLALADPRASSFARPGSPLVSPGEFVIGLPRQSPSDITGAAPAWPVTPKWACNGSFMVIRRLNQDVAAFRDFCGRAAALHAGGPGKPGDYPGLTPDALAALLVGRWPSGAPLTRTPHADDTSLGADDFAANDYGYQSPWGSPALGSACLNPALTLPRGVSRRDTHSRPVADPGGLICPTGAHVRKVNPRDQDSDLGGAIDTLRRHVLRRGLPYGPSFDSDPAQERGLLFVCYQASVKEQFATLMINWVNRATAPRETPPGHDLLIGQGTGRRATLISGAGAVVNIEANPTWVTPTGGEYFFAPAIGAIRNVLAALPV